MSVSATKGVGASAQKAQFLEKLNHWHSAFASIHGRRASKQDIAKAALSIKGIHEHLSDRRASPKRQRKSFRLKSANVPSTLMLTSVPRASLKERVDCQSSANFVGTSTIPEAAGESSRESGELSDEGSFGFGDRNFASFPGDEPVVLPFDISCGDDLSSKYSTLCRSSLQDSNELDNELPCSQSSFSQAIVLPTDECNRKARRGTRKKARSNNNFRRLQLKKKRYVIEKKKKRTSTAVRLRKWQAKFAIC